jgi:pyruvyltransferase
MNKSKIIKMYWWRPTSFQGNFGDELSAPIIEKNSNVKVEWASLEKCDHLGAGSILDFPWTNNAIEINPNITILGSGLMSPNFFYPRIKNVKFVAVRGWLTHSILKSQGYYINRNIGDLGILASTLISDHQEKEYELGFIPHHSSFIKYQKIIHSDRKINFIDVRTNNCLDLLHEISKCKIIISESLHGLIAADSLFIPNVWLKNGALHKGDDFKFIDYFSTIGRNPNDFIKLSELNNYNAIQEVIHKNWRSVNQLKVQVKDWLSDHLSEIN